MGGVNFSDVKSDQSGSRTVSRDLKFTYISHSDCGRHSGRKRRAEVGHIDREGGGRTHDREATRSTNWIAKVIPRSTTDRAIQEESSQVTLGERGSDTLTARSTNGIAKVIPRSTTDRAIQEESSQVTLGERGSDTSTARSTNGIAKVIQRSTTDKAIQEESSQVTFHSGSSLNCSTARTNIGWKQSTARVN